MVLSAPLILLASEEKWVITLKKSKGYTLCGWACFVTLNSQCSDKIYVLRNFLFFGILSIMYLKVAIKYVYICED